MWNGLTSLIAGERSHPLNLKHASTAVNTIPLPKHPKLLLKASFAPSEPALSPKRGLHKASLIRTEILVPEVPGKVCPVQTFTFRLDGHPTLLVSDHVRIECGDTVKLYLKDSSGKWTFKSYSPTKTSHHPGEIDITVKLYPDGQNAKLLRSLRAGQDHIYMAGPWRRKQRLPTSHAYLIAFGIGITEIYPVAKQLVQDGIPTTLLYANRYREDVCFRPELDLLEREEHPLQVKYLYSRETNNLAANEFSGRLDSSKVLQAILELKQNTDSMSKDIASISSHIRFLAIGSKPMMRQAWNCLSNLGYPQDRYELLQVS